MIDYLAHSAKKTLCYSALSLPLEMGHAYEYLQGGAINCQDGTLVLMSTKFINNTTPAVSTPSVITNKTSN